MRTIKVSATETGVTLESIRPMDTLPFIGSPVVVYDVTADEYYDGKVTARSRNNGNKYSVQVGEKRTGRFQVNIIPLFILPGEGWDKVMGDYGSEHYSYGKFCLANLRRRIRQPVSNKSSWLCQPEACGFREWRKRKGLPPTKCRPSSNGGGPVAKGERVRQYILTELEREPMTSGGLAQRVGIGIEAVRYHLNKKLVPGGLVERVGQKGQAVLWGLIGGRDGLASRHA